MTQLSEHLVVKVNPSSLTILDCFAGVTTAASAMGVTRQAMHNALAEGSVCAGHRWLYAAHYQTHVELHGGVKLEDFIRSRTTV
jgi:hypothetical protein